MSTFDDTHARRIDAFSVDGVAGSIDGATENVKSRSEIADAARGESTNATNAHDERGS